jgi:UTP--glucose-1-phosphate uridylyltransferase
VVAYPDDLHMGSLPLAAQLAQAYEETGCSVMASVTESGDVSRYGVLSLSSDGRHVSGIVEKPAPGTEPSKEISIGRYLYTPEFFELLEEGWKKHLAEAELAKRVPGEYFHVYALNALMAAGKVVYCPCKGQRLDTGDPVGYLDALLRYADTRPELSAVIDRFIATRGELG